MAARSLVAPPPITAVSPLVESFQSSPIGRAGLLPRPPGIFQAAFGPNPPLYPMSIDTVTEDTGQPTSRRTQYPVAWNLPTGVPGSEGLGKLAPFGTLRGYADAFSVIRRCLDARIQEILGLTWDIVPTPSAAKAMEGSTTARTDWEMRKAEMMEFWMRPDNGPDSPYATWEEFMRALLEDCLVCDAVGLHPLRPRGGPGKGVCGSNVSSIKLIDGTTIRPLYDVLGGAPPPSTPAYQQFLWGVPRVDYTMLQEGLDLSTLEDTYVRDFQYSQLLYLIREKRTWAPYGQSAIEKALLPIRIGLARQSMQLQFFTTGSVPYMFVIPGAELIQSPQQVRQLQTALNRVAGDTGWKQRIVVLPPNSKAEPIKPNDLADQFDEFIISLCTMALGLTPTDVGIAPRVAAVQSPAASNQMSKVQSSNSQDRWLKPFCEWIGASFFTLMIQQVFGQADMMWDWTGLEQAEDLSQKMSDAISLVKTSLISIDEGRKMIGYDELGLPETSVPLVFTATGATPLSASVQQSLEPPPAPALPPAVAAQPDEGQGSGQGVDQASGDVGRVDSTGELTTPAHEAAEAVSAGEHGSSTKAALAELDTLGRVLKKGRAVSSFVPKALSAAVLAAVEASQPLGVDGAVAAGRAVLEAEYGAVRRVGHVKMASIDLMDDLGTAVRKAKAGHLSVAMLRSRSQVAWMNAVTAVHKSALRDAVDAGYEWPQNVTVTVPMSEPLDRLVRKALRNQPFRDDVDALVATLHTVYRATYALAEKAAKAPKAAGLVVMASDTGRVLMVQRAIDNANTQMAGLWEWPGGKLDDGERPLDAAKREWAQETGIAVPDGKLVGQWSSANGKYLAFVWAIDHESDLELNDARGLDGSGDSEVENVAWWDPSKLPGNPAVRIEVQSSDWAQLATCSKALAGAVAVVVPSTEKITRTLPPELAREAQPGDSIVDEVSGRRYVVKRLDADGRAELELP